MVKFNRRGFLKCVTALGIVVPLLSNTTSCGGTVENVRNGTTVQLRNDEELSEKEKAQLILLLETPLYDGDKLYSSHVSITRPMEAGYTRSAGETSGDGKVSSNLGMDLETNTYHGKISVPSSILKVATRVQSSLGKEIDPEIKITTVDEIIYSNRPNRPDNAYVDGTKDVFVSAGASYDRLLLYILHELSHASNGNDGGFHPSVELATYQQIIRTWELFPEIGIGLVNSNSLFPKFGEDFASRNLIPENNSSNNDYELAKIAAMEALVANEGDFQAAAKYIADMGEKESNERVIEKYKGSFGDLLPLRERAIDSVCDNLGGDLGELLRDTKRINSPKERQIWEKGTKTLKTYSFKPDIESLVSRHMSMGLMSPVTSAYPILRTIQDKGYTLTE